MLLALLLAPAPLLPPHGLAEAVQRMLGVQEKTAYLLAAVGLRGGFYLALGIIAAFAVRRPRSLRQWLIAGSALPAVVVAVAVAIRLMKLGHVPLLANAVVPLVACAVGTVLGLAGRVRGWRVTAGIAVLMAVAVLWVWTRGVPSDLAAATRADLQRLVAAGPGLPAGAARFGALWQTAFDAAAQSASESAVQRNRAGIVALGIALGHERLARFAGLDRDDDLVRAAAALRQGVTLRGREDWARHYALSAALVVIEGPFLSDTGGLIKEELDALTQGSGFSFGDLVADRSGIRFAEVATRSEEHARSLQTRLRAGFTVDDFFPPAAGLPENLSTGDFRTMIGGVGSPQYRELVGEIDAQLDHCPGLALQLSAPSGIR